ncbi:MAG TPA: c-type cytochrome [Blastocatellia bacterium]|jgi:cytochrome c553|nr:c-type cytochrome [Blastocatellia bacterium]
MTAKLAATLICAAAFGSTAPALAAGSKEAGQTKSTPCVACHGIDGNSANPEWPSIAGQHESYFVRQLKAFRAGERQNPLMSPMAAGLSDEDIADLAAFYSSQTARGGEAEPSKLKLGQKVYRAGNMEEQTMACAACHGPTGRGNPLASYPAIQGQHATYVATQLRAYKSGARTNDPNQMMRSVAVRLSDAEIDAVASYVQGLR